jgi:hypothetical protein
LVVVTGGFTTAAGRGGNRADFELGQPAFQQGDLVAALLDLRGQPRDLAVERVHPRQHVGDRRGCRGAGGRSRTRAGLELREEGAIAAGEDLALQRRHLGLKLAQPRFCGGVEAALRQRRGGKGQHQRCEQPGFVAKKSCHLGPVQVCLAG